MAVSFLDTNVFLYAAMRDLAAGDRYKKSIATDLIARGELGTSTQVLAEFYCNARRKGSDPLTHDEAMEWIELIAALPCANVDADLVRAGASIATRYGISYWDGAVLAAATELNAEIFYSEDLNHGQRYGDVTVINPFLETSN